MDWTIDYGVDPGDAIGILGVDHVFYEAEMRTGGSLAWNNYNPGNIVQSAFTDDNGAYAGKWNIRFAVFPDEATGYDAILALLRTSTYYGLSLLKTFDKYAPASDGNHPEVYAAAVAQALSAEGVTIDTTIEEIDNLGGLTTVADRIKVVEGWTPGQSYSMEDDLPQDVVDWLDTYPDADSRAAHDQPFGARGAHGPGIANLQQLLTDAGHPAAVDGSYGPDSETAAKSFQRANNLTADGKFGPGSWAKLAALLGI